MYFQLFWKELPTQFNLSEGKVSKWTLIFTLQFLAYILIEFGLYVPISPYYENSRRKNMTSLDWNLRGSHEICMEVLELATAKDARKFFLKLLQRDRIAWKNAPVVYQQPRRMYQCTTTHTLPKLQNGFDCISQGWIYSTSLTFGYVPVARKRVVVVSVLPHHSYLFTPEDNE